MSGIEDDPFANLGPVNDRRERSAPPAPTADEITDPVLKAAYACVDFPLNDTGNGARFRVHFGDDLLWVPRVGWFDWSGQVWRKDADMIAVRTRAQRLGPLIEKETRFIAVPADRAALVDRKDEIDTDIARLRRIPQKSRTDVQSAELDDLVSQRAEIDVILGGVQDRIGQRLRHAKNAGNSGPIGNMITEGGVGLARDVAEIDAADLDVNTESGVLRFKVESVAGAKYKRADVALLPHDRAHLMTKMMPVHFNPDAVAPEFNRFLSRIQPDPEMRGFLQRWFGLSMLGISVQRLCFFYGMGANGKSVLVDLITRILGDYAASAKIESLTGTNRRGGGDATPDLVPMIGSRFLRTSEPDEGMRWQEGLIKELTGGETILVRALHSDFVEVRPKFKLTISGNHKPDIRGTDDGIWRRLLLVPFDEQISAAEQIQKDELDAILFAERDGVFAWLVEGALNVLEAGLREPEAVTTATQSFREESDPYGTYLDEACVVTGDSDDSMKARELVNGFHFWLAERAEGAFKDRTVANALKDRSRRWRSRKTGQKFTESKSNGLAKYNGLKFTDVFRRRFDDAPKDHTGRPLARASDGFASDDA